MKSANQDSMDIDHGLGAAGAIDEESSSGDEGFFMPNNARLRKNGAVLNAYDHVLFRNLCRERSR
jgi:hypothetical protein